MGFCFQKRSPLGSNPGVIKIIHVRDYLAFAPSQQKIQEYIMWKYDVFVRKMYRWACKLVLLNQKMLPHGLRDGSSVIMIPIRSKSGSLQQKMGFWLQKRSVEALLLSLGTQ